MNPEGGYQHFQYHDYNDISSLWKYLLVGKVGYPKRELFLRGESFYNIGMIHDNDEDIRKHPNFRPWVQEQSHGQAFLGIIRETGANTPVLYLLDEPETSLSMEYQMSLLYFIIQAARDGSQFVIATHSPMLMAVPDAEILLFGEEKLRPITLEETDAYGTMKMFMDNRELFIKKMIDDMEEN